MCHFGVYFGHKLQHLGQILSETGTNQWFEELNWQQGTKNSKLDLSQLNRMSGHPKHAGLLCSSLV